MQQTARRMLEAESIMNVDPVTGEAIYVPIYSSIFYHDASRTIELAATLSVHNTDMAEAITLRSVRYYDLKGRLIKQILERASACCSLWKRSISSSRKGTATAAPVPISSRMGCLDAGEQPDCGGGDDQHLLRSGNLFRHERKGDPPVGCRDPLRAFISAVTQNG